MRAANPQAADATARAAPDGDADTAAGFEQGFTAPSCRLRGRLKPDVVFFGDNVPKARVGAVHTALDEAARPAGDRPPR